MDYSSAFTGILIFASSRIRAGNMPMNAFALLTVQLVSYGWIRLGAINFISLTLTEKFLYFIDDEKRQQQKEGK